METEQYLKRKPVTEESSGIFTFHTQEVSIEYRKDKSNGSYRTSGGKEANGIEIKFERDGEKLLALGIYRFRDGKLELCTCTDEDKIDVFVFAPHEFKSDKADGRVLLFVLERLEPKRDQK